jgi:hypothetical protein
MRYDGESRTLTVVSPCFQEHDSSMQYEVPLLALSGITFDHATSAGAPPSDDQTTPERGEISTAFVVRYHQVLQAPDSAQPDVWVARRDVEWAPGRTHVRIQPDDYLSQVRLQIYVLPVRSPSLAPLTSGPRVPTRAWSGEIRLQGQQPFRLGSRVTRVPVTELFGAPAYRFEDVEVLGFRVDLRGLDRDVERDLAALIDPLNFHLCGPGGRAAGRAYGASPDFRYRAATRTLVIELLRYGRMKARDPSPPFEVTDCQSQHELVVRLLVGRVDDDTAQAHDPAVYVPAIFVDNPWSKILGRDMLGFDKRMADFWSVQDGEPARLLPDGRVATLGRPQRPGDPLVHENTPVPLGDISRISLVNRAGAAQGPALVDFEFSSTNHTDPDALSRIGFGLELGNSLLASTRWRQSDFDEAEFRRWFAHTAVGDSLTRCRGIQVAPVEDRRLDRPWVTGTFAVDALRVAIPFGVASLTLHAVPPDTASPSAPSAHPAWYLLCVMLGDGKPADIALPTGHWYRLLCSMNLTIDDGLDWAG